MEFSNVVELSLLAGKGLLAAPLESQATRIFSSIDKALRQVDEVREAEFSGLMPGAALKAGGREPDEVRTALLDLVFANAVLGEWGLLPLPLVAAGGSVTFWDGWMRFPYGKYVPERNPAHVAHEWLASAAGREAGYCRLDAPEGRGLHYAMRCAKGGVPVLVTRAQPPERIRYFVLTENGMLYDSSGEAQESAADDVYWVCTRTRG